jgi:hypothetical protein
VRGFINKVPDIFTPISYIRGAANIFLTRKTSMRRSQHEDKARSACRNEDRNAFVRNRIKIFKSGTCTWSSSGPRYMRVS